MSIFEQPIAEHVWDIKYRYRQDGTIIDKTIEDTWQRIARAVAKNESPATRKHWTQQFYHLLENFRFLPGGRIIAGAGVKRKLTLFNCFVMKIGEDAIPAIFNALKEGAITLQQGGGVGYDFSILRPSGEYCAQTGSIASGPVSFMRVWDSMSATMQSSGSRRGAMMGHLRCDHPDIEKFIQIKSDPKELRQFNLSVIVTDEFMTAVAQDKDWKLVFPVQTLSPSNNKIIMRRWSGGSEVVPCQIYRSVKARELWQHIIHAAYSYAEPGVIFEDTINKLNPLWYAEWISATNPCGEIPLPFYGACNLGSLNLTTFIKNSFTKHAAFDWQALEHATAMATRFLDNVIDLSHYPLAQQRKAALNTRRIGLGFTGLADAFVMLGIRYGSKKSLSLASDITRCMAYATWTTSCTLAKEKGSFPLFKEKDYLKGRYVKSLPLSIKRQILKNGMRNSHHNAIAPTGSISLLANNISSGLEPIYAAKYERQIRNLDGSSLTFNIRDYAYYHWQKMHKKDLPTAWVDINSLSPLDHLNIQGAVQPYIDNAISKTINLPENFPFNKLSEIYSQAYQLELKGCTIYRPNPITGSVLSIDETDQCCHTK